MKPESIELRELNMDDIEEIKTFFVEVFTKEPWNEDWSNEEQLHAYITDLIGNRNSIALGLFENKDMVGLTMGKTIHWCTGTEYYVDEFCIKRKEQGRGLGTQFLEAVEEYIKLKGMTQIFLQTERHVPAYRLYKKNGFIELEDHVSFFKQCK